MVKDRILVVDDDPDNRAMIGHFLVNWGYTVEDAKNGKVALEKIKASPPSLVLLDLEMPEMDGFETCERLKTDPETEWIPVIIFTGLEKMPHRIRGFRHGADDYVVKTVEPDELRTRIDLVLKRTKRYATLAALPVTDEAASSETDGAPAAAPAPAPTPARAGARAPAAEPDVPVITGETRESVAVSVALSSIPFPDAMRLVLSHGKSGVAFLTDGDRNGTVHVHEGAIIHAASGDERGSEAFYELALWKNGRFEFQETDPGSERSILTSTRSLLVEASRRFDAWSTISSKIPSFDWIPRLVPLGAESIRLTSSDWAVIRLVDGRRSIRAIVDELKTDIFLAGRIVHSLLTVGVLELIESAEPHDDAFDLVPRRGESVVVPEPYELSAAEWNLLSRVDGARTLAAIRELLALPAPVMMKMIRGLKDKGFLQFAGREQRKRRGA
jgi:CheY-like chemotaxis protein